MKNDQRSIAERLNALGMWYSEETPYHGRRAIMSCDGDCFGYMNAKEAAEFLNIIEPLFEISARAVLTLVEYEENGNTVSHAKTLGVLRRIVYSE